MLATLEIQTVRLAYGYSDTPYHFTLVLPLPNQHVMPENRQPGYIYVEDYMPTDEAHHLALGKFLGAWSNLEDVVDGMFMQISECDQITGQTIIDTMGSAQRLREAISSLAKKNFLPACARESTLYWNV
ncbi:hypothetical protein HN018_22785 (plasmid) [Lichenicola cladoniae]|uniref:Uncharacterized protein n=1 Tax=Lichenicola cladoniae TaxID=1484109 RepID=A0A6M8HXG0_9PROT|nr:hypothetical protein [Lichenicola cladoniae]NPD69329.1 hypothetical protein [Acetobacteraceae bacterium]QKE93030.1 hypothetical protein HN018_22785 [Lichenicola cladoniae]